MNKMIKYTIVFLTLALFINVGSCESISGYVTDENSVGLSGVTITDNSTANTTTTNTTGYYTISGYTNLTTYVITGTLRGYIDNTLTVNVNGNMTNQDITLTEKGMLYEVFELIKELVDHTSKILDLVIFSITLTLVFGIGTFILTQIKRVKG